MAVCYLDLDGFKHINNTHGHDAGDAVLRVVAQRLQRGVRPSDTVARLGSEEFVVALTPVHGRADSLAVLQRLLADIMQPIPLATGAVVSVSSSIGVALGFADGATADELLIRADQAMFESKRAGRCGIRFHDGKRGAPKQFDPGCAARRVDAVRRSWHSIMSMTARCRPRPRSR